MTTLKKPVRRVTNTALDGSYGRDRNKRIVVTLTPGDGKKIPDVLELRPERTRRAERIAVMDVYRFAIRARANLELLEKARARKGKLAARRESARIARADARLRRQARERQA